jgi:multiple sugar transport system permease protein
MVDGATPFQAFYRVILPLALPGLAATAVYIFLTAWDELLFAQVLTTQDIATIPVGIRNFVGNFQNRYDLVMAAATVATLPVLFLSSSSSASSSRASPPARSRVRKEPP